jgi:hypothetical protein
VAFDQLGEVGGDQVVLAAGQPGVGEAFLHDQALLGEPGRLGPGELLVGHVGVGLPAPQGEGSAEPLGVGSVGQLGEPVGVHVVGA